MSVLENPSPKCGATRLVLPRVLPVLVYGAALLLMVENAFALFQFPLDDAWIHGVYARSFAEGHGFAYNPGQQEAGSTSPLWAIVSAPAHWLAGAGADHVVVGVKAITVLLGLGCLKAIASIGRRLCGAEWAGCVAACLFAVEPRFLFSSLSGMENVLLLSLWLGGGAALLAGNHLSSAVLFGLAPVARPEAMVVLPLAIPGLILHSRRRGWAPATLAAWVLPAIPVTAWMLFCLATTGHPLPTTYYVKAASFELSASALRAAWEVFRANGGLPLHALAWGTAAFLLACRRQRSWLALAILLGAPLAYFLGVAGTRSLNASGYYWTRWMDPASLIVAAAASVGFGRLLVPLGAKEVPARRPAWWSWASSVVAASVLASAAPSFMRSFDDRRHHLVTDSRAIFTMNVRTGLWIADNTPVDAVIAANDAGAIRFFGRRRTIDLVGLNYAPIAFGREDALSVLQQQVDWIAIFPWWYRGTAVWPVLERRFVARAGFDIPLQEYTVCPCPTQTSIVVAEVAR